MENLSPLTAIVPAQAGTHNPWHSNSSTAFTPAFQLRGHGVWVPAFAGTTAECFLRRHASRRVPLPHPVDQRVFPIRQAAQSQRQRVGAAIVHVAVELPGESHAAMHLDVIFRAM